MSLPNLSLSSPSAATGGTSTATGGTVYLLNTGDAGNAGPGKPGVNWLAVGIVAGCGLVLWFVMRRAR